MALDVILTIFDIIKAEGRIVKLIRERDREISRIYISKNTHVEMKLRRVPNHVGKTSTGRRTCPKNHQRAVDGKLTGIVNRDRPGVCCGCLDCATAINIR